MLTAAAFLATMPLMAGTGTVGNHTYNYIDNGDGTVTLSRYDEYGNWIDDPISPEPVGDFVLPSEIDGKTVVAIGEEFFYYNGYYGMTSITIPASVTEIGAYAFADSGLAAVTFNEGLKSIGEGAFYEAPLTAVVIPSSVMWIGGYAFGWCHSLSNVTLNEGLESIGYEVFVSTALTSVVIPTTVTEIGGEAFAYCSNLTTVTFAGDVSQVNISGSAFKNTPWNAALPFEMIVEDGLLTGYRGTCPATLTASDWPDGVTVIDYGVFYDNTALTEVSIPSTVKRIGGNAFMGCSSLATVTLNEGLESIGYDAFYSTALTEVVIPSTVTEIGSSAFASCSTLTTVTFAGDVSQVDIAGSAFKNTPWNAALPFEMVVEDGVVTGYRGTCPNALMASDWPDGVTSIGMYVFEGTALTEVMIPSTVTSIGYYAFAYCSSLTHAYLPKASEGVVDVGSAFGGSPVSVYYYDGDAPAFVTVTLDANGGVVGSSTFNAMPDYAIGVLPEPTRSGYNFLGWFTAAEGGDEVTADTVVTGAMTVYAHWEEIVYTYNYIDNGDGTVTLWRYDEYGNWIDEPISPEPVGDFVLPGEIDGKTVVAIGEYFFDGYGITSIIIPASVAEIGEYAFGYCHQLATVAFAGIEGNIDIAATAFVGTSYNDNKPFSLIIKNGSLIGIQGRAPANLVLSDYLDGQTLTGIGSSALSGSTYDMSSVTNVVVPEGVRYLNSDAFFGDAALESIILPTSLQTIQWGAFRYCTALHEIRIPSGVSYIGSAVFYGCNNLTVHAPDTLRGTFSVPDGCAIEYYNVPQYTVTFDANGGTIDGEATYVTTVFEGRTLSVGTTPYRDGYDFAGWFGNDGKRVSSEFVVTDNVTLTARWLEASPWGWYMAWYDDGTEVALITGAEDNAVVVNGVLSIPASIMALNDDGEVVNLPVIGIEYRAFVGYRSIETLVLPSSIIYIGAGAFNRCTSLATVTFEGDRDSIYMEDGVRSVFYGTPWLNAQPFTFETYEEDGDVYLTGWYGSPVPKTSFVIPEGVTYVDTSALPRWYTELDGERYRRFCGWYTAEVGGDRIDSKDADIMAVSGGTTLYAHWEYVEPEWYFDIEDGRAIIYGNSVDLVGDVVIPASVTVEEDDGNGGVLEVTCPVTVIAEGAFYDMNGITSVTIPASVTRIVDWAFEDCYGLTNVVFEGSMESIKMNVFIAFYGTPWVATYRASLPQPVNDDFENASTIAGAIGHVTGTTIRASREVEDLIPDCYDSECTSTVWYRWTAPKSRRYIFRAEDTDSDWGRSCAIGITYGFDSRNDEWIDAEVSCDEVEFWAYAGQTYWIEVGSYYESDADNEEMEFVLSWEEAPPAWSCQLDYDDQTSVGVAVINGGSWLFDDVAVPSMVKSGYDAEGNYRVGAFPVVAIGEDALRNIGTVTSVFIPSSISMIGDGAFSGCHALTNVVFESGMDAVEMNVARAFYGTPWLDALPFSFVTAEENGEVCLTDCYGSPVPEELKLPDDVTVVKAGTLPALGWKEDGGVYFEFVGWYTAAEGGELVDWYNDVAVTGGITLYARWETFEPEWYYYIGENGATIEGYSIPLSGDVVIPSSVTVEEDDENGGVREVTYPVTAIAEDAFCDMDGITSVTIPASVTRIEDWAFEECYGLTNVVFEGGIESIEMNVGYAFNGTPWLGSYLASLPSPSNDDFADATAISGGSGSVTGTNMGAGIEDGEPLYTYAESTATVWWSWTAPKSGSFAFDTHGSDFDTVLGVYTGNAADGFALVGENDDDKDYTSVVTFDAVAGTTYYIAVGGYEDDIGSIVLNWSEVLVIVDAGTNTVIDNGDGTYTVRPPKGGELTAADVDSVTVTAFVEGSWVDTTAGYDIVLAGGVITVGLKAPEVYVAVDDTLKDSDDKSGFLVDPGKVTVAAPPADDETLGALPVDAVPGLWYQASWGDSLDNMTSGEKVQATSSALYLGVIKQTGDKGFYKLNVSEK